MAKTKDAPPTETRTIIALIPDGAPLLQQYDLPDPDGVAGDLLVGVSTALLERLGDPGAVEVTVTVTPCEVPSDEQRAERTDVVG